MIIGACWSVQSFSTLGIRLSGPAPLHGFRHLSCCNTNCSLMKQREAVGFLTIGEVFGFSKQAKKLFNLSGLKMNSGLELE